MYTKTKSISTLIWNGAFESIQQRGLSWQLVTRAGGDYTMMAKQTVLDVASFPWEQRFWTCTDASHQTVPIP